MSNFPTGIAIGLGSMPGESATAAMAIIAGELSQLHIAELPMRGPGAEMVGRTFALLNEIDSTLAVQLTASGFRSDQSKNLLMKRASEWLREDFSAFELLIPAASSGVKLQLCGPFTLAASVEPVTGDRLLQDLGAVKELAAALVEVATLQVGRLAANLNPTEITIQIDEPSLSAAVSGSIPTRSGRGRVAPISDSFAGHLLREVVEGIKATGAIVLIHSCANDVPISTLHSSTADAVSFPITGLNPANFEPFTDLLAAGIKYVCGIDAERGTVTDAVLSIQRVANQIGLPTAEIPSNFAVSHTCGLAFEAEPVRTLERLRQVAQGLSERKDERG